MKKYGKTEEEILVEKNIQCREIVREILNFGVDELQKKQIIKLLSLELENGDLMRKIGNLLSENNNSNESNNKVITLE